jgi:hypothetical protein
MAGERARGAGAVSDGSAAGRGEEPARCGAGVRKNESWARPELSKCTLPSAVDLALDKDFFNFKIYFGECPLTRTRQQFFSIFKIYYTECRSRLGILSGLHMKS